MDKRKNKNLTENDLKQVERINQEISDIIVSKKSIEDIFSVCSKIDSLDFDYPPQYTSKFIKMIENIIRKSSEEQTRDFFSFSHTIRCKMIINYQKER